MNVTLPLWLADELSLLLWRFLEGGPPSRVPTHAAQERALYDALIAAIAEVKG